MSPAENHPDDSDRHFDEVLAEYLRRIDRGEKVEREEFLELLSDHTEITQGVFKAIVGRMRGLIDRVGSDPTHKTGS